KVAYDEKNLVFSGPTVKSVNIEKNRIILSFDHVGSGLTKKGKTLGGFAIAAEDGNYVWAKAKIKGNKVFVWSDKVSSPVSVRYAWADNPDKANLYNKEGLPASPFQATNR